MATKQPRFEIKKDQYQLELVYGKKDESVVSSILAVLNDISGFWSYCYYTPEMKGKNGIRVKGPKWLITRVYDAIFEYYDKALKAKKG